jgi:N4-gp56 family major capsid protein
MAVKNITTTSRISHPINIFLIKKFLAYALPKMLFEQFGEKVDMPEHVGDVVKWLKWAKPAAQTTPMDEVNDPTPIMPVQSELSARVSRYGANIIWSEWLDLTGISGLNNELTTYLAKMFQLTIDTLCREVLAGSATTLTCSNGDPTATLLNKTDVDSASLTLLTNEAEYITERMGASEGVGTTPISPSFVAIANTNLRNDIEKIAGFKHVTNYAQPGQAFDGEFGITGDVRWLLTTNGYVSGSNYYCPIIGKGAYGNVKLPAGEKLLGYKPPEESGSRMDLYSIYYWKTVYACKILYDTKLLTLICTKA